MPAYYTGAGDKGDTGLFGTTERLSKASIRIEVNGQIDELQSFIGLGRSVAKERNAEKTNEILKQVQEHLFYLGADIASPAKSKTKRMDQSNVQWLEEEIDKLTNELPPLKNFVLPSGSRLATLLHVCRAIARRAEREAVALNAEEKLNEYAMAYLNRLSSLFFVLALEENKKSGLKEEEWKP